MHVTTPLFNVGSRFQDAVGTQEVSASLPVKGAFFAAVTLCNGVDQDRRLSTWMVTFILSKCGGECTVLLE